MSGDRLQKIVAYRREWVCGFDAARLDIGGKMGTAGLASQPLINNWKGAQTTKGVRSQRVRPPWPIETDHDPQGLCAVIWRDAGIHGHHRTLRSILAV